MGEDRDSMYTAGRSAEAGGGSSTLSHSPSTLPLRGRVCVVTGANRGLGRATSLGLARLGATVVMLGRDAERIELARDDVRRESGNADVSHLLVDLGSLASVRAAAAELKRRYAAIHVLVNNAGVNLGRRAVSADGFEMTLAVNHLGPFLLTNLLVPLLEAGAPARVVNVTSWFERFGRIDFKDLHSQRRRYGPLRAYYQSKLANALFTYELAERLSKRRVSVNCVDPGLVATDLLRDRAWWNPRWLRPLWRMLLLSPDAGSRAAIFAASAPDIANVTGRCFGVRRRPIRTSRRSQDTTSRKRLWEISAQLTGVGHRAPR